MICMKCGVPNDDGAKFCANCGADLTVNGAQPNQSDNGTNPVNPVNPANAYNGFAATPNPVIAAIKSFVRTPLVLTAIILFTVSVVLGSFTITNGASAETDEAVLGFLEDAGLNAEINNAEVTGSSPKISFNLNVLNILFVIALWLIYADSKRDTVSTSGFTLIKVASIISIVLLSLLAFLFVILAIFSGVLASVLPLEEYFAEIASDLPISVSSLAGTAFGIVFGFAAVIVGIAIFYYAKILKTVSTAKQTLLTGVAASKGVSVFVAVMCFISGAQILGAIVGGLWSLCTLTVSGVASVLFGIIIIKYRDLMKSFE